MVMVTFAVDAVHGALLIDQRTITGPAPPVCVNVAFGEAALEKVPVPPLTTLHAPVPVVGVLPPSPVVVPFTQMVCAPPTVAAVGGWLIVMVASPVDGVQGALLMVQRTMTGPAPPVCVKVAFGEVAFEKVPVPPLTTLHAPVPMSGVLPPSPLVVPFAQMVWPVPTVAAEGGGFTVMSTSAVSGSQGALLVVQRSRYGPDPRFGVNVALPVV